MKKSLLFDFIVDKTKNAIRVKREFAAPVEMVWEAWTNPELLDQWWAPRPFQTITKSMDFREGGVWLYYMKGPNGEIHWCKADYLKINPIEFFSGLDAFCDENGVINTEFPRTVWENTFENKGETTIVHVLAKYESLEALEKIIEMGFKEGFTMALGNLDELLSGK